MSDNQHKSDTTTRLADWTAFPFTLEAVELDFTLRPRGTVVRSALRLVPKGAGADLVLDGVGLRTTALAIDGEPMPLDLAQGPRMTITAAMLPAGPFTLTTTVEIDPEDNKTLEGLYTSGGMFCTQCEAEGFRHITWYPDRPDVMAPFTVTLRSDLPALLSNGNPVSRENGVAVWHDPWPKPSYLFALVAGDLVAVSDRFTTASGRPVDLNVWVRPGDQDRAGYALESLIRAMKWDEEAYGREYDLDVFNLVAVDDFNMGAMENKGLNIFNSKLVLASPETATDGDYERIEGVIGHEYFHNWTGNRITCRDWFQLCLKEGLTVFRDQQFTADMRSAPVKRIADVVALRGRQFREDSGPLAHPPRPDHYKEINNFYTATVYEKGAEVVGMLHRLVGADGYRKALDLYFTRHDGQACTIEDWLKVFEDATGRDLTQFRLWYTDAGTPHLTLAEDWDAEAGRLTLTFTQTTAPTPGQPDKPARLIPIAVGLIGPNGDEVAPTRLLEMTEPTQSFTFAGLGARPVASVLRDFSAPVTLSHDLSPADRAVLLAHDTDPFARWEAGRDLALAALTGGDADAYVGAIGALIADAGIDPAFLALCLSLPGEDELAAHIAARGDTPDPDAIHAAREALATRLGHDHGAALAALYDRVAVPGPYQPLAEPSGRRAERLAALSLLTRAEGPARAQVLAREAGNMTERMGAIAALVRAGAAGEALAALERDFGDNRLVMDKFFAVQVQSAPPAGAVTTARALAGRADFDWQNPNRFRALIAGFGANHAAFHAADGSGYAFIADWLIEMDKVNPQTAARMSGLFETWRRFDATRRSHATAALRRIADQPELSRNTAEMVGRILGV